MKIISWQRALILWFQDKVEILETHNRYVRTVKNQFLVPSILRLKSYVRPRVHGAVRFCRENVYIRDNYSCQYCGEKSALKHLTLDHVVPVSHGGPKSWTNVVTACRTCNQRKADRTPKQANMPLMKEPKVPSWLPPQDFQFRSAHVPETWFQYLKFQAG